MLQTLWSETEITHTFLTPRAYRICPSTCAFSMELLAGQSLHEHIRKTRDRKVFDDSLRLAATWLRGLHRYQLNCETGYGHAKMLGQIELHCVSLTERNKVAGKAVTLMRNSLNALEQNSIMLVPLHGDFKASNLIKTNAGLYGIDIGLKFKNEGAMDAAQFMADLILNRHAIQVIRKEHDLTNMVDVFMQAYGDNSPENRNRIVWWLLFFILSWWQRELDGWKPALLVDRCYAKALADVIAFSECKPTNLKSTVKTAKNTNNADE